MRDELKIKLQKAKQLEIKYKEAYASDDFEQGKTLERQFLALRQEILDEIDAEVEAKKSIPLAVLRERQRNEPRPIPRETGIAKLDRELVPKKEYNGLKLGGFPLGNFIQLAGSPGSGKTSLFMKILSGFSKVEPVSWFNFEMSDEQVLEKLEAFDRVEKNILYYNSGRELEEIIKEIKYLYADGVRHFVIDSAMKIRSKGKDGVELFMKISDTLKELTSILNINIYLINQLSQADQKNGVLALKYGNAAEYDSDFIFYMLKPILRDAAGKPILDEAGQVQYDETKRFLKCHKNRAYDRLFTVEIDHSDIFGVEVVEETYKDEITMPYV